MVWSIANDVPPEWYGGNLAEMEALVEKLLARRRGVRALIDAFRNSDRRPFPNWGKGQEEDLAESWKEAAWGATMRVQ